MITFDKKTHTYYVDGEPIRWSVTELLKQEGYIKYYNSNKQAMLFGEYVHKATALYDQDKLDEESLDDRIKPYLEGWKMFLDECNVGLAIDEIENPLAIRELNIAGTPDRIGNVLSPANKSIIEIKTGSFNDAYYLQVAGYQFLYNRMWDQPSPRVCIVVLKKNNYQLIACEEQKRYRELFRGMLAGANWKLEHNLIRKEREND